MKVVEEEEVVPIANEWGITIEKSQDESANKPVTVDAKENNMSLDELRNQLGGMFGKK